MGKGTNVSQPSSSTSDPVQLMIHNAQYDHDPTEIDLDLVISHIDAFLSAINQGSSGSNYIPPRIKLTDLAQPAVISDFSEVLDGVAKGAKNLYSQKELMSKLCGEAQNEVLSALKGIGKLHVAAAGLLVVAHVLEKFQSISSNKEECLDLLKVMNDLAKCIKQLKNLTLKKEMAEKMNEAVLLIIQGAILCFSQMKTKYIYKLLFASRNREDLVKLRSQIKEMKENLMLQMQICDLDTSHNQASYHTSERLYPDHAVGIEDQVKQVIDLLEWESDKSAVAVVIHGFGGAGKTTVADAVVARLEFKGCKYSKVNLNESLQYNPDITKLQTRILQDLAGLHFKLVIRDYQSGQRALADIIQKEPVLIYIDNALKRGDLEKLLPRKLDCPKRIRLLLTVRNTIVTDVLQRFGIKYEIYSLKPLSHESAMEIFCSRISDQDRAINTKERHQINEIAEKCRSSPLLLEVMSGYLHRRRYEGEAYEGVLRWFEKGEPFSSSTQDSVYESIVFKDLRASAQDAFLDICSYFYGWKWDEVSCIVGKEDLETLQDGALLKKDEFNRVAVHDVLIGIGLEKSKGLRFRPTSREELQELETALADKENENQIKGIWLVENKIPFELSAERLEPMCRSLRVLALGDWTVITNGTCSKAFTNLLFFQAGDVPCLPFGLTKLGKLKFLDNCSGQDMGLDVLTIPPTLGVLKLSQRPYCRKFEIDPHAVPKLKNLRTLKLRGFDESMNVPEEFRAFTKLTNLSLSRCGVLQLPDSLSQLVVLQKLNLSNCTSLKQLPECIGKLPSLKNLDLSHCIHLKHLPPNFGFLKCLESLSLEGCESIQELPESFGLLESLKFLDLNSCLRLEKLQGSFEKLSSLKTLDVSECSNLVELPEGLGKLTSLVSLQLEFCGRLRSLPHCIGCLRFSSNSIHIIHCYRLREIPEEFCNLTFVEDVDFSSCYSLKQLPLRFIELTSLRRLDLSGCERLSRLPDGFYKLSCLEELDLKRCCKLADLCRDFESMPSLIRLDVSECSRLQGIWMESLVQIRSLKSVDIRGSWRLRKEWEQMKERQNWQIGVIAGQGMKNDERLLKEASSVFFSDDCILIDRYGSQFSPSAFLPNTTLALIFGPQSPYYDYYDWELVSENLTGLKSRTNDMQIVYIDRYVTAEESITSEMLYDLPEGSLGLPPSSKAWAILNTVLVHSELDCDKIISTKVDVDDNSQKCFSKWENISSMEERSFEAETYLHLKQLAADVGQGNGNNISLLRAFFVTKETDFLLRNSTEQVKVDDLKGKQVLIFISRLEIFQAEISIMKELYFKMQERQYDLEVIWIPIVDHYHDTWGSYIRRATTMPWLTITNPWLLDSAVLKFLNEDYYSNERPLLVVVDGEGRILNENAMEMVERWGAEAYPFTPDRDQQLKMAEYRQINLNSNLEFLFQDLDSTVNTKLVRGKMTCLFGGDPYEISDFTPNLISAFREIIANLQIIYIGRKRPRDVDLDREEEVHEKNRKGMPWLSISMLNAWRLWIRVTDLLQETAVEMECSEKLLSLRKLLTELKCVGDYSTGIWMMVLDESGDGVVTGRGKDLVELLWIGGEGQDELKESLTSSGVGGLRRFDDHIILPQHHRQHSLLQYDKPCGLDKECHMCEKGILEEICYYRCVVCQDFDMCRNCFDKLVELGRQQENL